MKRFLSAIAYTLMFLAIQAIAGMIVTVVYMLIKREPQTELPIEGTLITMLLFSLISMAVFILFKWFVPNRAYLRTKPWAVCFWSVIAALGALVPSLFFQELFTPVWPEWIQKIIDEANQQLSLIMTVPGGYFIVALLAPVVEEMVFRGAVLRVLLHRDEAHRSTLTVPRSPSKLVAVIISALLFAFAHLNPAQMPHAFLIGLLLGWLYLRTGSILPGIVYHWANNTAAYLMFHLYPDPDAKLSDIISGGTGTLLLAVAFSLCIFLPALYQLHLRMKPAEHDDFLI